MKTLSTYLDDDRVIFSYFKLFFIQPVYRFMRLSCQTVHPDNIKQPFKV